MSNHLGDELSQLLHCVCMLQYLIMVGFNWNHSTARPSSLYLARQHAVAVFVDEWIEPTVGYHVQHWLGIDMPFHVAYEMGFASYLRDQFAAAEIYLQQVQFQPR